MLPVIHQLAALPVGLEREQVATLATGADFRLEHIRSGDHVSPPGFWYDQPEAEWAILLCGCAELQFQCGRLQLRAGDAILIAAHQRHRIVSSNAAIWLALHFST